MKTFLIALFHLFTFGLFTRSSAAGPMLLIKWSGIGVTEARGKLGGTIFSKNKGGHYSKNFTVPTNPQTPAQQAVRGGFGGLSQIWRTLTQGQRDAWDTAAPTFPVINKLGEVIFLSGQGLYMQLNLNREAIGSNPLVVPPAQVGAQVLSSVILDADTTAGTFNIAIGEGIEATTTFIIQATPGVSAGVSNVKNLYKQIATADTAGIPDPPLNADFATEYEAVYGVLPPVGDKVFVRLIGINENTGERGVATEGQDVAV